MKRILFCLQTMVCGGVEKELITILKRFDRTEYELSVLLLYEQDLEMQMSIPADVKLQVLNIDQTYYCSDAKTLALERIKKRRIIEAAKVFGGRLLFGIPAHTTIVFSNLPEIAEKYDYAVCYHMHSSMLLRFVAEKVNAKCKIAWIHNDFTTTQFQISKYGKWLSDYQKIVGVSSQLSQEFQEKCPKLADRVITVHNVVDTEDIQRKAMDLSEVEQAFLHDNRFKIVTVGRFVEQKGFDLAIKASKLLKDKRLDFSWYAIGYGNDEEKLRNQVKQYGLEETFYILGRKENPYPYMDLADLYVQPSRHEGFAITVEEVKALKKLIVCTNFAGAIEQIQDGITGVIVPICTSVSIVESIAELIVDPNKRMELIENIQKNSCMDAWEQIIGVFEE